MDPVEKARTLAEAMSNGMNVLAALASPSPPVDDAFRIEAVASLKRLEGVTPSSELKGVIDALEAWRPPAPLPPSVPGNASASLMAILSQAPTPPRL